LVLTCPSAAYSADDRGALVLPGFQRIDIMSIIGQLREGWAIQQMALEFA
jgi:hypothetical protein